MGLSNGKEAATHTGLFELWKLNLLHESMEAVVWDNVKFRSLFTPDELAEVRYRL